MFTQVHSGRSRFGIGAWCASAVLHGAALFCLFHASSPSFLAPRFVAHGEDGTFIAQLYWPGEAGKIASDATSASALASRRERLIYQSKQVRKSERHYEKHESKAVAESANAGAQQPVPAGGSAFGTSLQGLAYGNEVRPALPILSPDPAVDETDLGGAEGDVIVEVTIDDHGMIVEKKIIQSMGASVDNKVLAAVAHWQFHPATRNGFPIPSKQDLYYHFPALHHG